MHGVAYHAPLQAFIELKQEAERENLRWLRQRNADHAIARYKPRQFRFP